MVELPNSDRPDDDADDSRVEPQVTHPEKIWTPGEMEDSLEGSQPELVPNHHMDRDINTTPDQEGGGRCGIEVEQKRHRYHRSGIDDVHTSGERELTFPHQ